SQSKESTKADAPIASSGAGAVGGGYGPMAPMARGAASSREHHSPLAETLDGGGEPGAVLSQSDASWIPVTRPNDAPFVVSEVSWGPSSALFDDLAPAAEPELPQYADAPQPTLEQVSNRWVSPSVIGVDKRLTL